MEGQEEFRLYCADMNKNYSKQQIWSPRDLCQKNNMGHSGEMGRNKRC